MGELRKAAVIVPSYTVHQMFSKFLSKTRLYVFDQCFYWEQSESETSIVMFILPFFQQRVPCSVAMNSRSFPSSEKKMFF